ncbi:hypothetical protein [Microbacterium pumilum]|uniref:Uncharacterized protein n=1 Tax=Microbacterium pumilum TaxID=344165 RepID=A0ABN2SH33_9MICO
MDVWSTPSDAGRELDDLRARAYGPHPDIQADPTALARLSELEAAAHIASPTGGTVTESGAAAVAYAQKVSDCVETEIGPDKPAHASGVAAVVASSESPPQSLRDRLTATRGGLGSVVAGALVVIVTLVYTMAWLVGPHPDATLQPIDDPADDAVVLSMLDFLGADADPSTVRGYQSYRGVEPWFLVDKQGFHCFMIIYRPSGVDGANCVPPGVDLFADISVDGTSADDLSEGLPDGSVIRFRYRGDSVEVFLYPASESD